MPFVKTQKLFSKYCDWLTKLEHLQLEGHLSDLKEKPKGSLLINWLGRKATQVLKSVGVEVNNPK